MTIFLDFFTRSFYKISFIKIGLSSVKPASVEYPPRSKSPKNVSPGAGSGSLCPPPVFRFTPQWRSGKRAAGGRASGGEKKRKTPTTFLRSQVDSGAASKKEN